jgi:AcrR family transcriptional regulator
VSSVRPLRADAARNRRAVLDAARDAFARHGVTASLDDVARAAGVGAGTLYRHFPSRDDLVLAVIDDGLVELHDLAVALLDEPDPLAAVDQWLSAYIEQGSMFDGLAQTLASPPAAAGEDSNCRRARDAGAALLRRATDAGVLRADVDYLDVLDLSAAIAWVGQQSGRDTAQRERLLRTIFDGIRAG